MKASTVWANQALQVSPREVLKALQATMIEMGKEPTRSLTIAAAGNQTALWRVVGFSNIYLFYLLLNILMVGWKRKKNGRGGETRPSNTSPLLLCRDTLPTSVNFVYVRLGNLSLMLSLPKRNMNWIDKAWCFSLSSFSLFQMFKKKKVVSPIRKAHLWVKHKPRELGRCGLGFCGNFCPQGTLYSWLAQITLHFWLPSFQGAICFEAHLSRAMLWLTIKYICSWCFKKKKWQKEKHLQEGEEKK